MTQPFEPDAEIHIEYTPTQVVSEFIRHKLKDSNGSRIRGLLYNSAKEKGAVNLALFIESKEVEGVPSDSWLPQKALIRLISAKEV